MKILSGIDLVYLPRFKKSLKSGGENFLRRVYHQDELVNSKIAHLAGIFAIKEAVIKALSLDGGSWLDIKTEYEANGTPRIHLYHPRLAINSHSVSISHDSNYVIAQFIALAEQ